MCSFPDIPAGNVHVLFTCLQFNEVVLGTVTGRIIGRFD
jgi:hypothetical protein